MKRLLYALLGIYAIIASMLGMFGMAVGLTVVARIHDVASAPLSEHLEDRDQATGVVLIHAWESDGTGWDGTGFVISSSGYVLTAYHVVEGTEDIQVVDAATEDEYDAELVNYDTTNDVALLKMHNAEDLDTVAINPNANLGIGDDVTAVGNANGVGYLVYAEGQVQGLDETFYVEDESQPRRGLIAFDAEVYPGDSGGPVFNSANEVVALTTLSIGDGEGGAAVPISVAVEVADDYVDNLPYS